MKYVYLLALILGSGNTFAQNKTAYPTPEFSNEISFLNKEKMTLLRLEKGSSKLATKATLGGMGGGSSSYNLDGSRSPVRLGSGTQLSFVITTGSGSGTSLEQDSIMKANGMDPAMQSGMSQGLDMMNDPSRTTSLYNTNIENGVRKITVQAYGGMKLFGKAKKESIRYTFSVKKIKEGYYEVVVDKMLPKGEYAFLLTNLTGTDGEYLLFAFGID